LVPLTVSVKALLPAVAEIGLMLLMVGVAATTVTLIDFVSPPTILVIHIVAVCGTVEKQGPHPN